MTEVYEFNIFILMFILILTLFAQVLWFSIMLNSIVHDDPVKKFVTF